MTVIFLILALAQLGLGWVAVFSFRRTHSWYTLLLALVIFGMFYENAIVGLGVWIGQGPLLQGLNAGRYLIHVFLTPLLVIVAFGLARKAGVAWAHSRRAHAVACLLAVLLIALGVYLDLFQLALTPAMEMGILRYANTGGMPGPPIPAILTILVIIAAGFNIWRKTGWIWLLLGSAAMFLAAGAGASLLLLGNSGEILLMLSLITTNQHFTQPG